MMSAFETHDLTWPQFPRERRGFDQNFLGQKSVTHHKKIYIFFLNPWLNPFLSENIFSWEKVSSPLATITTANIIKLSSSFVDFNLENIYKFCHPPKIYINYFQTLSLGCWVSYVFCYLKFTLTLSKPEKGENIYIFHLNSLGNKNNEMWNFHFHDILLFKIMFSYYFFHSILMLLKKNGYISAFFHALIIKMLKIMSWRRRRRSLLSRLIIIVSSLHDVSMRVVVINFELTWYIMHDVLMFPFAIQWRPTFFFSLKLTQILLYHSFFASFEALIFCLPKKLFLPVWKS